MKTVLITGATSGIGEAFAQIFAKNGISLFLVSRDIQKLESVSKSIAKISDVPIQTFAIDLSEGDSANKVFHFAVEKGIQIDYLVNNAGIGDYGEFQYMDEQKIATLLELNVVTLTKLTRLFLEKMVQKDFGRILNVASTAAFQPGPLMAVYFASKAYVLHFSLAVAKELEKTNVTLTTLCPGPTHSNFAHTASIQKLKMFSDKNLPSALEVAEFGFSAMMSGKKLAIHGFMNRMKAFFIKFIPLDLILSEISKMLEKA